MLDLRAPASAAEREHCHDLRRTVLCGELHLDGAAARDELDAGAFHLLAFDGEKPVGTGRLCRRGGRCVVEHVAVLPAWRRRGVGRALVLGLLRQGAGQAGEVWAVGPAAAVPFLEACGFSLKVEDQGTVLMALSI